MTNEQASEILDDYDVNFHGHTAEEVAQAFDCAFKALEQQPCEDCISREQAIKQCGFGMTSLLIADCLRRLPPVTPQSDNRLEKIADIVEGTIDHLDRDDALDMLYQIKEVLR